jgi:hypothetical protein
MPIGNFFLIQFVDLFFYRLVTCQNFPVKCIFIPINTVAEYNSGYDINLSQGCTVYVFSKIVMLEISCVLSEVSE